MAEDWAAVASEVAGAIAEVGFDATLRRTTGGPQTPWDTAVTTETEYTATVVDDGIKTRYGRADDGALIARTARVLTIAVGDVTPAMGDRITVAGAEHVIAGVMPTAPGGVALLFEVELAQ